MKNKIVFSVAALLLVAQIDAKAKPADKNIAFRNMEVLHKADWFDYMGKIHGDKYELLKKQHAECASLANQNLGDIQNLAHCSDEEKSKVFAVQLDKEVALHRKHTTEFEKMCKSHYEDAAKIQARHDKELNAFIKPVK